MARVPYPGVDPYLAQLSRAVLTRVREITASDDLRITDGLLAVDSTAGVVTVTLPSLQGAQGWGPFVVARLAGGNNVTISGDANINGAASVTLSSIGAAVLLFAGASEWKSVTLA